MKKSLVFLAAAGLLSSSPSFGSLARMESLGGRDKGDLYMNDMERMFRNPSALVDHTDMAIIEWGTANSDNIAGSNHVAGTLAAPKPQGGFTRSLGNWSYGLYFGRNQNDDLRAHATALTTRKYLAETNSTHLFIGGDSDIMWGASLRFAHGKDEQTATLASDTNLTNVAKQSAFDLNLGVTAGAFEAYANLGLQDKSEKNVAASSVATDQTEFKAKFGLTLGLQYNHDDLLFFAHYRSRGYEETNIAGVMDVDYDTTDMHFGLGQIVRIDSAAKMFFDLRFNHTKTEGQSSKSSNSPVSQESTTVTVPITMGFETQVKEWLALRGSIAHNIYSYAENAKKQKKTFVADGTDVNAGATLSFGKLKVDGRIGTTNLTTASGETGLLALDRLLTQVSLVYFF